MKYFKDSFDGVYALGDKVQPSLTWIEISEQEYLMLNPPPAPVVVPLQARIDEFVRQTSGGRVDNELQLEGLTAGLLGAHLAMGGTEPQLEVSNSAYRQAKQLRAAVATMRAQG